MRAVTVSLLVVALAGVASAEATDVTKLAREYRQLRKKDQATKDWVPSLHEFGSRYHELLGILGATLSDGSYTKKKVVKLMGKPDVVVKPGDDLWESSLDGATDPSVLDEILVYQWRGFHDYLFFHVDEGTVVSHGWWAALE